MVQAILFRQPNSTVAKLGSYLVKIEAKFGENAPETNFYRKQLTTARDELEQFERAIDDSTDPGLRVEAEKACEKALNRYRKRLTMTKEELAATRKLEREENEWVMAELIKRRRQLDDKPPGAQVAARNPNQIFLYGEPAA